MCERTITDMDREDMATMERLHRLRAYEDVQFSIDFVSFPEDNTTIWASYYDHEERHHHRIIGSGPFKGALDEALAELESTRIG